MCIRDSSIREGEQYKIDEVNIIGDVPLDEGMYNPILEGLKDQIYSQAQITSIEEYLVNFLGNEGYTFAEVTGNPEMSEEANKVSLIFLVQPGNRTYARKILFSGNYLTNDEVLRREMRQFEGAWASDNLIEGSKLRLERLGFFKEVNVETIPVPGTEDQVDIEFTVEEESTSSIGGSIGYSDFGMNLGLNLSDNNFLGTGNRFNLAINKSVYQEAYNVSFFDPYFTMDGVSRGYSVYYRVTDYGEYNVANYLTNSMGGGVQFGYPISDITRIGLNLNFDNTDIDPGSLPSREIADFLASEGTVFDVFKAQAVWSRSINVLKESVKYGLRTKTGIMLGLGETKNEVINTMQQIVDLGVEIFTIGQYLQPTKKHLPVSRYLTDDEFKYFKQEGLKMGFLVVESGALVRSSYRADEQARLAKVV